MLKSNIISKKTLLQSFFNACNQIKTTLPNFSEVGLCDTYYNEKYDFN